MKLSRFSKARITDMLKKQESGLPSVVVCRKHSVSQATFYKYKAEYGGMNDNGTEFTSTAILGWCQTTGKGNWDSGHSGIER